MDQKIRKLMTMHKALPPREDVDRLYVSWKEVGGGLASIEVNVDASIQRLEHYREKRRRLITGTGNNTDNMRISRETKMVRKTTVRTF